MQIGTGIRGLYNLISTFRRFAYYRLLQKLLATADEISKSCCVGENEENNMKNRSQEVIPYDRNRVSNNVLLS